MVRNAHEDRESICYEQNCEQARHLNQIIWQVPIIAMTLTGGLWYAVASVKGVGPVIRSVALAYSAVANLGLVLMILRVRDVFGTYLEKIREYHPSSFASAKDGGLLVPFLKDRSVVRIFSLLMILAAAVSISGAVAILGGWWVVSP